MKKFKTHCNLSPQEYRASRSGHFENRRVELVARAIRRARPARVLEIGCGAGDLLAAVAEQFAATQCVGVDVDAGLVALAAESFQRPNLTFLCGDVAGEEVAAFTPVDFAYCVDVIHHFHDHLATFRSIRGLLPQGGTWLAIEPNIWHPYVTFQQERMIRAGYDEGHFAPWRMKPLLRRAGFEIRDVTFAHLLPPAVRSVPAWLERLERVLERTPLTGASAVYTLVAT